MRRFFKKTTGPFRLRSRSALIAATVLLQAVVIGLGWLATMQVAQSGMESGYRERLLEQTARAVAEVNAAISREVTEPLPREGSAWERAQRVVEQATRTGGVTVLLVDPQGRVLCHPAIRTSPSLRRMDYSEQQLVLIPDGELVEVGQLRPLSPMTAWADLLSGEACVAVLYNPALRVKVIAIQSSQASDAAMARLSGGAMRWLGLGGASILLLTIAGSWVLVRRYDTVMMRTNERLEIELERRVRRGLVIRDGLIFGLAKLADFRDTDTGRHLERIRGYCEILAQRLRATHPQIDQEWVSLLKVASSLHDIGKVGIPDSILLKPGALLPDERRQMERHANYGADTLIAIRARVGDDDLLNMSIQIAMCHHERWDGTGYPSRLQGEQIPLSARVVALADVYDAMTSRRVYKQALGHEQARSAIRASRGTHFDPSIADAFEAMHEEFDALRGSLQSEGADERPHLLDASIAAQAKTAA